MKTLVLTLCLLAACAAAGGGAAARDDKKEKARPDLSGAWGLDRSKSDFGPFAGRPLSKADSTLVVAHRDPDLKVRNTLRLNGQQEVKEFTYYTDGRGETNPAAIGPGEIKSKTRWEGDRVVARARVTRRGERGSYEFDTTQKWQVSADGKALTNTTLITSPVGVQEIKLVYRRGE